MIGADPCTEAVGMMLDLDQAGYIRCGDDAAASDGPNRWPLERPPAPPARDRPARRLRRGRRPRRRDASASPGAVGDGALAVRFAHQVLGDQAGGAGGISAASPSPGTSTRSV